MGQREVRIEIERAPQRGLGGAGISEMRARQSNEEVDFRIELVAICKPFAQVRRLAPLALVGKCAEPLDTGLRRGRGRAGPCRARLRPWPRLCNRAVRPPDGVFAARSRAVGLDVVAGSAFVAGAATIRLR
jgi:hypothetical protein